MRTIAVLIFVLAFMVMLPTATWCTPSEVELTVDAGPSATPLPLKIGHCVSQYKLGGAWTPSLSQPQSSAFDSNAGDVVGFAGMRGAGLLRFPNGNEAEEYHWRRGVGPMDLRPRQGSNWDQTRWYQYFGTDDFMLFVNKVNSVPGAEPRSGVPLITVNWFDWNNPDGHVPVPGWNRDVFAPETGPQEAANWVEYCNGAVTPQLITTATNSGWAPSQFVDDEGYPSQSPSARERAISTYNGNRCNWLSYEQAPTGYFAWLRYHFLTTVYAKAADDSTTLNGYGVVYWEVGNEVAKYEFHTAPMDGYVTPEYYYGDLNDEEANPGGFFAYCKKMKSALGGTAIKVGAWIDSLGNANLYSGTWGNWAVDGAGNYMMTPTDQPVASGPWLDRLSDLIRATVPTGGDDPTDYLDWLSVHFGDTGDKDYHIWIFGSRNLYDGSTKYPSIPALKAVELLPNTTYTFRVRAKGMTLTNTQPSDYTDYPLMQIQLFRNGTVQETCSASDTRACQSGETGSTEADHGKSVWVCRSKASPDYYYYTAGPPSYPSDQRTNHTSTDGEDYAFTLTTGPNFTEGDYTPWVKTTNNPSPGHNGRTVDVLFATIQADGGPETPLTTEWGPEVEPALAISAPSIITGRRLDTLREYVNGTGLHQLGMPNVEIAATELDFLWSRDNGLEDRTANWGCALSVAEMLRMMADGGKLDFANYHNLQDYNQCFIIQHNGVYDNYASGLYYPGGISKSGIYPQAARDALSIRPSSLLSRAVRTAKTESDPSLVHRIPACFSLRPTTILHADSTGPLPIIMPLAA